MYARVWYIDCNQSLTPQIISFWFMIWKWEGWLGWGIHVYPWLIHVSVWKKPLQYCIVSSLQLIKKIIKEKKRKKKKIKIYEIYWENIEIYHHIFHCVLSKTKNQHPVINNICTYIHNIHQPTSFSYTEWILSSLVVNRTKYFKFSLELGIS